MSEKESEKDPLVSSWKVEALLRRPGETHPRFEGATGRWLPEGLNRFFGKVFGGDDAAELVNERERENELGRMLKLELERCICLWCSGEADKLVPCELRRSLI